jgi:hypothetical protein
MVSGYSVTFIVASGNQDAVVAAARVAFTHLYVRLAAELSGLDYQCELATSEIFAFRSSLSPPTTFQYVFALRTLVQRLIR